MKRRKKPETQPRVVEESRVRAINTMKKRYGKQHYADIGRKGALKRWEGVEDNGDN